MERNTFIKHLGASALSLCALGSLSLVRSSIIPEINKAFLLSHESIPFQVSEVAEGMQKLAALSDGPVHASGNTVQLKIGDTVRCLEIKVYS